MGYFDSHIISDMEKIRPNNEILVNKIGIAVEQWLIVQTGLLLINAIFYNKKIKFGISRSW